MDYEEKILKKLVEAYRKSKKDTGKSIVNRRTKIKPESLYSKYHDNDGDFDKISAINLAVSNLIKVGFVSTDSERFSSELVSIYLVDEKIAEVESFLTTKYGYTSKDNNLQLLKSIISKYKDASNICSSECDILLKDFEKRKVPKNINELDDILNAVSFIDNNTKKLYLREASMRIYGDSKYLEEKTLSAVCSIFHKYNGSDKSGNLENNDEILEKYSIYREPQKISIKGNTIITINGKDIDISGFKNGIDFAVDDIENVDFVKICAKAFITVENRTSYLRYHHSDKVVFYLGGYANRFQRDFIKQVYKDNPDINYEHFGDIDAGGFWIHHNLCEITGVNFKLFSMSINELNNPNYKSCIHKLTENDVLRLQKLCEIAEYKKVVKYMLENNLKLEQEIISLDLMS